MLKEIVKIFSFNGKIFEASSKALKMCEEKFKEIEKIKEYNQQKVLKSFINCKVSESHFNGTTGYGYNDRGREKLDELFADIFKCEDALVRHNFVSGTHTLTTALFGVMRPGESFLSVTGKPYDTLEDVIGCKGKNMGSLKNFGIEFDSVELDNNKEKYFNDVKTKLLNKNFKMLYIQRSRGYTLRDSLSISIIEEIISFVKNINPGIIIMVDNCYGEFVEEKEPCEIGADLMVGSLIKNPGGAICSTGGYIAGRKDLIEQCSYRLTAPGIGKEIGATLGISRELFMGIYNAPNVVGEALKSAVFASALFEILGYEVYPNYNEHRCDIVQSVVLRTSENLVNFCKGIQAGSPIDSYVSPEPWDMPGYENQVIMAAGTFTSGSSIELSADGPLKFPYTVWLQGGTNFYASKIGIIKAAQYISNC